MRRFVFRAQAALDFRRRLEDDAKRTLAAANAAVDEAQASLDASVARREAELAEAGRHHATATDVASLEWYRNWIGEQQREVARGEQRLADRRADAETARGHVTKARIDVRVLEKLHDRARRAYDADVRRDEQKQIDWLAVLRSFTGPGGQGSDE